MTTYTLLFDLFVNKEAAQKESAAWLALLVLAIIIIVVIWALTRNASFTEMPHVEHGHEQDEHVHEGHEHVHTEEHAHAEPAAPVVEPPAVDAVRMQAATLAAEDDLEIIEGIGPKIAGVFKEAGIHTFAQLAASDVQSLRDILLKAELRLGDPTTWPEQARLAAAGDLEGLKALQDSLKGGRKA